MLQSSAVAVLLLGRRLVAPPILVSAVCTVHGDREKVMSSELGFACCLLGFLRTEQIGRVNSLMGRLFYQYVLNS